MKLQTNLYIFITCLFLLLLCACEKNNNCRKTTFKPSMYTSDTENNTGIGYWEKGDYPEALEHFTKAYNLAKKNKDNELIATLLNNMGLVQWRMNNYKEAMECYTEAAKLGEQLGDSVLVGLTHTNRSLILRDEKKYKSAFEHNNKAIAIFEKLNDAYNLAIVYNNQGQLYRYTGNPDRALHYYQLSLSKCSEDNLNQKATGLQNIASCYRDKGNAKKSFDAIHKAIKISLKLNNKVRISEGYSELSQFHEKFRHPDSALYYMKKHYALQMEIMDDSENEKLSQNLAKLGMEVKNLKIENLQKEKEIAKIQLGGIISALLALLVIIGFFFYRHFSKMRFKRRQLELELSNSHQIIEIREQELKTYIIDLSRKNAIISSLQEEPQEVEEPTNPTEEEIAALLEQKILTDDDWETFRLRFKSIYPDFFTKISESHIALTEAENRLLVLMRLELNSKDMANILGISPQSVRVCKMRLKKKLSADKYESVEDFLAELTLSSQP